MNERKINIGKIITVTGIVFIAYLILEALLFFRREGCICTFGYESAIGSKIIGWLLLIISVVIFIVSIMQKRKFSKWGMTLSFIIFGIAFYGNGYMLNGLMGGCGYSLNKTTFFVVQTKLGDFATEWGLDIDRLKTEEYKGKLLGYSLSGKKLTLYRIGDKPLKVRTSFLFWELQDKFVINALHSYRNVQYEENNTGYEFIGGQDMPIEVFLNEFLTNHNEFAGKILKNQRVINETDGTTRFRFEIE